MKEMERKEPEKVADFKARIARLMREREGAGNYELVGGPRGGRAVVRTEKSYGRNPWEKEEAS
jgi:hypothetical protein